MSTRQLSRHRIPIMMGQASGYNPEAIDKNKSLVAYNFYLQNGMLKKIPGSALYLHSSFGSSPIVWLAFYQQRAMWQLGQNILIEVSDGSQTELRVADDFNVARVFSDVWLEAIYLANGYDLKFYSDGSGMQDLGLLPPGAGTVPRQMFTGGSDPYVGPGTPNFPANSTLRYTMTYFDSETQTESLPIGSLPDEIGLFNTAEIDQENNPGGWLYLELDVGATGSNIAYIDLSSTFRSFIQNTAPTRADVFRIYRAIDTGSGFGDYQFFAGFPITNGVITDNTQSVEGLPALIEFWRIYDNDPQSTLLQVLLTEEAAPPPTREAAINSGAPETTVGPRYIRFWRDSLFLFGASFPQYTITDSFTGITEQNLAAKSFLYGSDTSLPEYYPFNWEIGSGDGQEATGLAVVGDILCIFKERSIYTLVGTSLSNFIPKIQDEVRGCIAPGSLQETPFGAICLSAAGVIGFKGTGLSEVLSNDILDEIQSINKNALDVIASSYDPINEIYTMYYPKGTATQNTMQMQLSIKDGGWTIGERAMFVASAVTIPKTEAPYKSLLGTFAGGNILSITSREVVSDYPDQRITAYWRSAPFDFGQPGFKKRLSWIFIRARCAVNWVINLNIYSTDDNTILFTLEDINSESTISRYAASTTDPDGAIYDENLYMGDQTTVYMKIPISGIAREFFVEITEATLEEERHSFDLISVDVDAEVLAR